MDIFYKLRWHLNKIRDFKRKIVLCKAIFNNKPVMYRFSIVKDEIIWPVEWYGQSLYFTHNMQLLRNYTPPK